jgi:hypothetical protein
MAYHNRLLAAAGRGAASAWKPDRFAEMLASADYFRRWHREKAQSGGLMVHKASHHFDLVNWWLGSSPREVFGYRDRNVFDGDISIEDDMAVLVRYASGASMSYHLTAYSPWEGYRVMFNGSVGRLELEVTESAWQPRRDGAESPGGAIHGEVAMANAGGATIRLRKLCERPSEVPVAVSHGGHGGGDERMLTALYGPAGSRGESESEPGLGSAKAKPGDPARQSAGQYDGALALAVGAAADECFLTGRPVC